MNLTSYKEQAKEIKAQKLKAKHAGMDWVMLESVKVVMGLV
jgi:hypothetical protein